jgi:hypothetical protein
MSNVAGKAYGMNVITPVLPTSTWLQRLIFMAARSFPATLAGLLGLSLIHFARWVLIKRDQWPEGDRGKPVLKYDYMLFCSNFNGTWDQYIDAFSDGIPQGLDLFWYTSFKYPLSIPITPFKSYIARNQFHNGYYYNATPGSAQRDIKAALKVFAALKQVESLYGSSGASEFAVTYNKFLATIQNCLGSPGYAPIASLDTEHADVNRAQFLNVPSDKRLGAAAPGATQNRLSSAKSGNTFDGGHCYLTALLPIKTNEIVDQAGMRSSPVHMIRDALASLPTAHQSPATQNLAKNSPFAKNTMTHFLRMAVIDDVIFNGRAPSNALIDAIANPFFHRADRTAPQGVDQLPGPYLLLAIDCDAKDENALFDYLRELWRTMAEDLVPVFSNCFGFTADTASAEDFADYVSRCRIETTMPFNDYWTSPPSLPHLSAIRLVLAGLVTAAVSYAGLCWATYALLGRAGMNSWLVDAIAAAAPGVLSLAAGLYVAYILVIAQGAKPYPQAPHSDLASVLKALYVQRALIWFATALQGAEPTRLYVAFGEFIRAIRLDDLQAPTQSPGTIPR